MVRLRCDAAGFFRWPAILIGFVIVLTCMATLGNIRVHASAVTAHTTVRFDQEPEKSDEALWLARLMIESESDEAVTVLGLAFARMPMGWFGPMWGLQLMSEVDVIPHGRTPEGPAFSRKSKVLTLLQGEPRWDREYEATLSFDPATGAAAVVVTDLTEKSLFFSRNLQLAPIHHESLSGNLTGDSPVSDAFVPAPPSWWLVQMDEVTERFLPARQIDRRKEAALSLDVPWHKFPGEFVLVLTDGEGEDVTHAFYDGSREYAFISVSDLEPGDYTASIRYVGPSGYWVLDERPVIVGVVEANVLDVHTAEDAEGTTMGGRLVLITDGPFDDLASGLDVSVIRRGFEYDPSQGRGLMIDSVEWNEVIPLPLMWTNTHVSEADFTVTFSGIEAQSPGDFWEIVLEPIVGPKEFLAEGGRFTKRLKDIRADSPWRPFLENERVQSEYIAPGIESMRLTGTIPAGPVEMHVIIADLSTPGISVDSLIGAHLTTPESSRWPRSQPSQMVASSGALVGINGDFFAIRDNMTPRGIVVHSGNVLKAESEGYVSIGFTDDNLPYIGYWGWRGGISLADGKTHRPLLGLNAQRPVGLTLFRAPALFTPGTDDPVDPATEIIVEVTSRDNTGMSPLRGIVREVRYGEPKYFLTPGVVAVSGRGDNGRYLLDTYHVGDEVEISYAITGSSEWPYLEDTTRLYAAVSGNVLLLREGQYGDVAKLATDTSRHPRTAIGFSMDQRTLYVLVVDGRSRRSVGMTFQEMADFFRHIGAFQAINLDGGGSSALVLRDGGENTRVLNVPSDGRERYVPVGLGIFFDYPLK